MIDIHYSEYLTNGIEQNSLLTIVAEKEDKIVSMGCISYFILPPNDWCTSGQTAYVGNLYKEIGFDFSPTAMAFYPFGIMPQE